MSQVYHICIALISCISAVVLALLRKTHKAGIKAGVLAKRFQRLRTEALIGLQKLPNLGKIRQRQSRILIGFRLSAAVHIAVANGFSQKLAVYGGIICQSPYPTGVIPAVPRLRLLRSHHVAAETGQRICYINRGHKASVKAYQFQRLIIGLIRRPNPGKRFIDFVQGQRIVFIQLIESHPADGPATVIPKNHRRSVGRVFLRRKVQKGFQCICRTHAGRTLLIHKLQSLGGIGITLQLVSVYYLVLPHRSTAGLNNHGDIFRQ